MKNAFTSAIFIIAVSFGGLFFYNKKIYGYNGPGETPPYAKKEKLDSAVMFAPGVISSVDDDFGGSFTPDGKTCFFSKSVLRFYIDVICFSQFKNGKWGTPEVAPFSGVNRDFDPSVSPDGTKILFTSSRSVHGEIKNDYDIWMIEKKGNGWGEPIHLDSPINSSYDEHFASIAANGNIYFSSNRPGALGGDGDADFYKAPLIDGKYPVAEHLVDSVSTASYELDCVIAPDESFLLMGAYGRPDGYGNYDIFISKRVNGKLGPSKNIGPKVNTRFRDYSPRVSPDGKYLFFTSEKGFVMPRDSTTFTYQQLEDHLHSILNGSGNIYQIELSALGVEPPVVHLSNQK